MGVPANLDTFAISGLTARDKLLIFYGTVAGNSVQLYQNTSAAALSANISGQNTGCMILSIDTVTNTAYLKTGFLGGSSLVGFDVGSVGSLTAWTGSWTIALRSLADVSSITQTGYWTIHKWAGQ